MRTSILSRSVIAVASLAIGSVALAAAPATAATPSGITRDQVLTAVHNWRTAPNAAFYYNVVEPQLAAIVRPSCGNTAKDYVYFDLEPLPTGQAVDGALIKAYIDNDDTDVRKQCLVAVIASKDAAKTLSGSLTLNATTEPRYEDGPVTNVPAATYALSRDVFITSPIAVSTESVIGDSSFTAKGSTTRSFKVTTTKKVADQKTKSQKKSAKKKLDQRNAAAKKAYKKALDKAGKNKSKKAAAKKAYAKKKASNKTAYKKATASYKIVTVTSTRVESSPFAVKAALVYGS